MNVDFYSKSHCDQVYLQKNQRVKHLKVTTGFSLAWSALLNILWQILLLQSWLLLLCTQRDSMKGNLTHGLMHIILVQFCALWLYGWVGFFVALDLFHICFFNGEMILKHIIMHAVPPEQEDCLGGWCILIPTVTTFHNNIRHRPTKVSVQAAKIYKWIMVCFLVCFLARYHSLTTWPIISMRIIISIIVYCLGLLLLFSLLVVFSFGFKNLLSHSFWLLNYTRFRDLSAMQNFELQIVKLWVCFSFLFSWTSMK